MSWVDGREVQQMGEFGMMQDEPTLLSLQGHIILLMQGFQHVNLWLFLIVESDTISRNGAEPPKSEQTSYI